jgi:hypothetical protein
MAFEDGITSSFTDVASRGASLRPQLVLHDRGLVKGRPGNALYPSDKKVET